MNRSIPLTDAEMDPSTLGLFARWRLDGELFNFFRTLARNPALAKAWTAFGTYIFAHTGLSGRQSELLILRTTWLCGSEYEFVHHIETSLRRAVLDRTDHLAIVAGPNDEHWSSTESALLRAADELEADARLGDHTWTQLAEDFTQPQIMDVIYTCGAYRVGATATNSLDVALEPTITRPNYLPMPHRDRRRP